MQTYKGIHNSFQYDSNDYLQDPLTIPESRDEVLYHKSIHYNVSPCDGLSYTPYTKAGVRRVATEGINAKRYQGGSYLSYTDVLYEHNVGISISRATKNRLSVYEMSVDELIIIMYGRIE